MDRTIPIPLIQWAKADLETRLNYLAMGMFIDPAELAKLAIKLKNSGKITMPQFERLKALLNGYLAHDGGRPTVCLACYDTGDGFFKHGEGTLPCEFCKAGV